MKPTYNGIEVLLQKKKKKPIQFNSILFYFILFTNDEVLFFFFLKVEEILLIRFKSQFSNIKEIIYIFFFNLSLIILGINAPSTISFKF